MDPAAFQISMAPPDLALNSDAFDGEFMSSSEFDTAFDQFKSSGIDLQTVQPTLPVQAILPVQHNPSIDPVLVSTPPLSTTYNTSSDWTDSSASNTPTTPPNDATFPSLVQLYPVPQTQALAQFQAQPQVEAQVQAPIPLAVQRLRSSSHTALDQGMNQNQYPSPTSQSGFEQPGFNSGDVPSGQLPYFNLPTPPVPQSVPVAEERVILGYWTPFGIVEPGNIKPLYCNVSTTQPDDPAFCTGPAKMPRRNRTYRPIPRSTPYASLSSSEDGDDETIPSATSRRNKKRSANAMAYHGQSKRQKVLANDYTDYNSSGNGNGTLFQMPGDYDNDNDNDADDDTVAAAPSTVRRKRNPGRKPTVKQTREVLLRNEKRRQRYRNSLPPAKRMLYDQNARLARAEAEAAADDDMAIGLEDA